jgi:uncharacterized damage-inducible protein DinB
MMKEEFKDLFEYSHQVNQKLMALLTENRSGISERTVQLVNHLLNAHQIWNARILGEKCFGVWQLNKWEDLNVIDRQNYIKSLQLVEVLDMEAWITYKNSSGAKLSDKTKDILFHIINHSTYHRAQIALLLREQGIDPINTDYIFYKRQVTRGS